MKSFYGYMVGFVINDNNIVKRIKEVQEILNEDFSPKLESLYFPSPFIPIGYFKGLVTDNDLNMIVRELCKINFEPFSLKISDINRNGDGLYRPAYIQALYEKQFNKNRFIHPVINQVFEETYKIFRKSSIKYDVMDPDLIIAEFKDYEPPGISYEEAEDLARARPRRAPRRGTRAIPRA